jgi:hypothetical protein
MAFLEPEFLWDLWSALLERFAHRWRGHFPGNASKYRSAAARSNATAAICQRGTAEAVFFALPDISFRSFPSAFQMSDV